VYGGRNEDTGAHPCAYPAHLSAHAQVQWIQKMGERKEREGWSGYDPETASFIGDFNANNTNCLDQRQCVSIWFKLTS
jgi:hypothetical protein